MLFQDKDNMSLLCFFPQGRKIIFGICQVWVRPTRFKDDVRKCVFLGYVPHTDRLIIYYNCESECVKITSYCKFDEGFNDLPTESVPLGFQHLICENLDEKLPPDQSEITSSDLEFFVYPFADKEIIDVLILPTKNNHQFGFKLKNDELYGRVYIDKISDKYSVFQAFNKSTLSKLWGSFINHIDYDPVFIA